MLAGVRFWLETDGPKAPREFGVENGAERKNPTQSLWALARQFPRCSMNRMPLLHVVDVRIPLGLVRTRKVDVTELCFDRTLQRVFPLLQLQPFDDGPGVFQ